MSDDISTYVNNPCLLVALCRAVLLEVQAARLNTDGSAMEAQLREIARAIDKLEKQGVSIPDALRAEKTRLAANLGAVAEADERIVLFVAEMSAFLAELAPARRAMDTSTDKTRRKKSPRTPKTDRGILRQLIIQGLQELGGAANKHDLFAVMEKNYANNFLAGDFDFMPDGRRIYWQYYSEWECTRMRHEGIIADTTIRGVWELSEAYR